MGVEWPYPTIWTKASGPRASLPCPRRLARSKIRGLDEIPDGELWQATWPQVARCATTRKTRGHLDLPPTLESRHLARQECLIRCQRTACDPWDDGAWGV